MACTSLKVGLSCISIIYELMLVLFHLQKMPIFYFTYSIIEEVVSVTVSTTRHSNAYSVYNIILSVYTINNYY